MLVHVDAGTQNAGGALHNAQRAQAGLVFCAGRAPLTWDGELRGSNDSPIHWWQEQLDQTSVVRNFVTWHYEPRAVLMLPARQVQLPGARQRNRARAGAGRPAALREAAELLLAAERH